MPGYAASTGTHRLYVKDFNGSDDWVDIKASRSSGDATRLLQAGARITGVDAFGRPTFDSVDLIVMEGMLFSQSIVAWSLKAREKREDEEDEPEPMPLTPEVFEGLDEQFANWLSRKIREHYQGRRLSEAALGNSSGPSTGP